MRDCHGTKGTPLLCLTDLQPVALKRLSIASLLIYIDLWAVMGHEFKENYLTRKHALIGC